MSRRAIAMRARPVQAEEWSGRRLLTVGAAVLAVATALLGGLGYAIYLTLAPPPPAEEASVVGPGTGSDLGAAEELWQRRRDAIAAEPMLSVGSRAALPAPPSTQSAPSITIPPATGSGPAGVPTGFPRTPEGAVAQLAAIETTVFQAMSMPLTAEIHQHWTLPDPSVASPDNGSEDGGEGAEAGGEDGVPEPAGVEAAVIDLDLDDTADLGTDPLGRAGLNGGDGDAPDTGVAGWDIARHVQSFLGTAQMGPEKDVTTTVTASPSAGLVKGSDGPDWVLACVLLEVRAVITTEARIGFGHCERMQWHDGRWLIGPGTPPARAPSTWPGTQQSIDAGWRTWADTGPTLDDVARDQTARDGTRLDDGRLDDGRPDDGDTGEG